MTPRENFRSDRGGLPPPPAPPDCFRRRRLGRGVFRGKSFLGGNVLGGDLAAGDALVRAAGGSVTTLEGAPVRYNQWDSLKAPKFVAAGDSEINYLERIPDPDL